MAKSGKHRILYNKKTSHKLLHQGIYRDMTMKPFNILIVLITLLVSTSFASANEHYIKFNINDKSELDSLTRVISIDNVDGLTVYAYASDSELAAFETLGYEYEILPHPGSLITAKSTSDPKALTDWDVYPTHSAYVAMMYQFATDYPDLCQIYDIGSTVQGKPILFAKISDSVAIEEDEPEVMYTSTMHGDETVGFINCLRLIDSLLTAYGTDSMVTRLVDSCEIWINPNANPDGSYGTNDLLYSPTRYNANGYDLNRNFADPDDGSNPGGTHQPETIAFMDFPADHSFVISANFHGGAEVVNYPWDTWSRMPTDVNWFIHISREYADSAQYYNSYLEYMDGFDNGITNGYDWYPISGGRQDFMNYWYHCREITIELSNTKMVSAVNLPTYWYYNRASMFNFLEQGLYGIRGVVTDVETGNPLYAMIRVLDYDSDDDSSMVYTDPDVGDYHRLIEPGTYDIEISCEPDYYPDTIYDLTVNYNMAVRADIALTPIPEYICGDANGDETFNIADVSAIINYIFFGGLVPDPLASANANGDESVNIADGSYMINSIFFGGPDPICE